MQKGLLDQGTNRDPSAGCFWSRWDEKTIHVWPWRPGDHQWPPAQGAPCVCGETTWDRPVTPKGGR